jgi:carbonic anhydrase
MRPNRVIRAGALPAPGAALLAALLCLSAVAAQASRPTASSPAAPAHGATEPAPAVSPEEALTRLKDGNYRFRNAEMQHPRVNAARVKETAENGQAPFATILGCSDSRVPCEFLFDQGIGDLFIIRVAGNVCDVDETGSIEYGVGHLGSPLLVVLGHEKCGAVTAVVKKAELEGSIPELVANIRPAVQAAEKLHPGMAPDALVPFALRTNVLQSIEDLLRRSEVVRELVREGKLAVVGAVYDLETGDVSWLGPHPRQAVLLKEGGKGDAGEAGEHDAPAHGKASH